MIDPARMGLPDLHTYLRYKLGVDERDAVKIYPDYLLIGNKNRISKEQVAEQLGRPGAKIEMIPGQTIVNGQVLDEPYTREDPDYTYPENGPRLCIWTTPTCL